jgi:glycosyltransferase involved in cell wall biosynthesis
MANEADGLQIECILIDDRGTDNSMTIVNRMIEAYNGTIDFRVITNEKNDGPSAARNTGIEAARGKYLWFVDSDDAIADNCLANVIKVLEADNLDILYIANTDVETPFSEQHHDFNSYSDVISGEEFLTTGPGKIPTGSICLFIFKKDFWEQYNFRFKEGIFYEDMHIRSYILSKAQKMRYLNGGSLYYYRQRETSIMHQMPKKINLYSWAVVVNTNLEHAKETESNALREHFLTVATHAFIMGTGLLHQLKGEREYVKYYMSNLHGFTTKQLRCSSLKERIIRSIILTHPYTYFKIRKAIYKLTKR